MTGGKLLLLFFLSAIIIAGAIDSPTTSAPTSFPPPVESSAPMPWPIPSTPKLTKHVSPFPSPMSTPVPPSNGIKGGYWPSFLADSFPPSTIPTQNFTHLFYAFLVPEATTYKLSITQHDEQWMGNFTATLHAKNPPAKAFLSIGGGNSSTPSTFSNMVSSLDTRGAFINSTILVARKYGFDGLDLDWEFPSNPQDMSNLSQLFSEWRAVIELDSLLSGKPRLLLSAAVYFAPKFFLAEVPRTYPVDAIQTYVDFVSPMCYDYHGSWETSVTGEHALLYDKASNISTSFGISSWIEIGVPPEKLVMGLPMYGRTWKLKDPNEHGIGAPAVGTGPGNLGILSYAQIVDFNLANRATVVYDNETVSMYSYAGTSWIGYDGLISVTNKVKFAQAQGLGGYFLWAIGYDNNWALSKAGNFYLFIFFFGYIENRNDLRSNTT